jgi:peptidoglycan/LPS O-acetylase OafA/YrhL
MDSLFCGVFLSYLHNFHPALVRRLMSNPWRFPIAALSVLALAPALFLPSTDPFIYTAGFTLVSIGFGTMLVLSIYKEDDKRRAEPGKAIRAIAWMGTYSYTLYLWHVPLAQVFGSVASKYPYVNQYLLHAIYFAVSIVTGVAASKLVEIPCLKLRERLFPRAVTPEATRFAPVLSPVGAESNS